MGACVGLVVLCWVGGCVRAWVGDSKGSVGGGHTARARTYIGPECMCVCVFCVCVRARVALRLQSSPGAA
jgi:hypothetical protein